MKFRHSLTRIVACALVIASAQAVSISASEAVKVRLGEARALMRAGDKDGAARVIEAALSREPGNVDALLLGGNLVRDRYGLLAALPWYDRALAIRSDHLDVLFEKAATLGDAGQSVASLAVARELLRVHQTMHRPVISKPFLPRVRANGNSPGPFCTDAGVHLLRATLLVQSGANEAAVAQLRLVTAVKPGNTKARRLLGLALQHSGGHREAIEILRPLAVLGDGYSLTLTGRAYEAIGNWQAAGDALDQATRPRASVEHERLEALDRFLVNNPANVSAQRAAADRALSRGEFGAAAAIYTSLVTRLGNRDPKRLVNAGWAQIGLGYPRAAVAFGARAYALAPMNALATASYGAFLARAGRVGDAVPLLEKAIAMMPTEVRFAEELDAAVAKAKTQP